MAKRKRKRKQSRPRPNTKTIKKAAKKYKKVKPVVAWSHPVVDNAEELDDEFNPIVSAHVLTQVINQQLVTVGKETAGFMLYDRSENKIVWSHWDDTEVATPSTVSSSSMKSTVASLVDNGVPPNVQYHTQPNMGTSPSGQDLSDQDNVLQTAMKVEDRGFRVFVIIDELTWSARLFEWDNGKVTQRDGYCQTEDGNILKTSVSYKDYATAYGTDDEWDKWWERSVYLSEDGEREGYRFANYDLHTIYRGYWSSDDSDYDKLFEIFGVQKYEWGKLWSTVSVYFPGLYWDIVDDESTWDITEELMNGMIESQISKAEDILLLGNGG